MSKHMIYSKSHTSVQKRNILRCIHTEKQKMQCPIHTLKTVQKLSVQRWTPKINMVLVTSLKWHNGVSMLANVSIH